MRANEYDMYAVKDLPNFMNEKVKETELKLVLSFRQAKTNCYSLKQVLFSFCWTLNLGIQYFLTTDVFRVRSLRRMEIFDKQTES
jgi:hypothetical protein